MMSFAENSKAPSDHASHYNKMEPTVSAKRADRDLETNEQKKQESISLVGGEQSERVPKVGSESEDIKGTFSGATQRTRTHAGVTEWISNHSLFDNEPDDKNTDEESKHQRNNSCINRARNLSGKIVANPYFQNFIVFLIVVNAVMMGVATFDIVSENETVSDAFEKTDKAFLIIFTIELGLQFMYHGLYLFKDGWLLFDFVIVLVSWSLESLQIIRAFRIFRALRLVTRVATLRNLVLALFAVLPRMAAITALLLLVFYIFAVMFTVLFKDLYRDGLTDQDYFSRLDTSFFTLFQMMTLDWTSVARQCMAAKKWAWGPFVVYIMISSFIVYNLIIAVVCDAVAEVEHEGEEDPETCDIDKEEESRRILELEKHVASLSQKQKEMLRLLELAIGDAKYLD